MNYVIINPYTVNRELPLSFSRQSLLWMYTYIYFLCHIYRQTTTHIGVSFDDRFGVVYLAVICRTHRMFVVKRQRSSTPFVWKTPKCSNGLKHRTTKPILQNTRTLNKTRFTNHSWHNFPFFFFALFFYVRKLFKIVFIILSEFWWRNNFINDKTGKKKNSNQFNVCWPVFVVLTHSNLYRCLNRVYFRWPNSEIVPKTT